MGCFETIIHDLRYRAEPDVVNSSLARFSPNNLYFKFVEARASQKFELIATYTNEQI